MKYYRVVDDCGWTYYIGTDMDDLTAANIALLVPHVRSAAEITKEEYENGGFNMNYAKECREILSHYGDKKQEVQAVQELSELILLLVARPDQRGNDYRANMVKEIADCEIMIEQVKQMHGITDCEVECEMHRKIGRQMKRMEADA